MRIRVIQRPSVDCIDGMRLDRFAPGQEYELGTSLAAVFLAEGWAEPVSDASSSPTIAGDLESVQGPPNLVREMFPPYYDGPAAFAADRRRRLRSKRPPV